MKNGKKNILIIMGRYLPGFKDGGPIRTIKNLVDYLGDEYNFKILTCDREVGEDRPYNNIIVNGWNAVGKASVYYVPPNGFKFSVIKKLSKDVDLVYSCGCFSDYAIKTLILKRLKRIGVPVVIASMGSFSPMEFKLKYKKKIFTNIFNFLGMFDNVFWSVTSEVEKEDVKRQINCKGNFFIATDLPRKVEDTRIIKEKDVGKLNIIWLSRIAPNKNLKGAIDIIKNIKGDIKFTIYGPKQDFEYWEECEIELNKLPNNIKWDWKGSVDSENVVETFKKHHVFLFPTFGENFGHVIQEALSAGCPVLLSDKTPWIDIEKENIGLVAPIEDKKVYQDQLELYVKMDQKEFQCISDKAVQYAINHSKKTINETGYRAIFNM
ncbi:MAG: glycosyltransferase family 4 protein [Clostridium perfringens]|nr:glycosyltransferase family 4 protein [Clostridium perfringens]EIF6169241.1 glycosyltransferase family 4 protein [Clostridium perfringens]MDU1686866.1 glycosyltransferase family 4 protein [Clostridium perfringens]MDU1810051.1 glycosyltransferase family 4 protein [Clostridium perfringens]